MDLLQQQGYIVHPQKLSITTAAWDEINTQAQRATSIFNHNTRRQNDFRRRQCHLHIRGQPGVQHVLRALTETVLPAYTQLNKIHTLKNMVVLESLPGCQQQMWHTDYNTTDLATIPLAKLPLGVIVALQDGTKFMVKGRWPAAQKPGRTVHLNRGDVLLFLADLVHAGAAYPTQRNIRLHAFIDSVCLQRQADATYFVHK